MFYVNAKYLARRMKIEEFVVQQTTNWTFLKKKCQACHSLAFSYYLTNLCDPTLVIGQSRFEVLHPYKYVRNALENCIKSADKNIFYNIGYG